MADLENLKKTPLFETHREYGGRLIDFGGWALPVQYEGIIEEHNAVRSAAGLFDVSHMGEIRVTGPEALKFVDYLLTNDLTKIKDNQIMYSPMCYPDGGTVDDLLTYRISEDEMFLVVNAANTDKDYEWISQNSEDFDVEVNNESPRFAQLALQGPECNDILAKVVSFDPDEIKFFRFKKDIEVAGHNALVSRTGYTGEDGFEIYTEAEAGPDVWNALMEAGEEYGLKPAGLGARDTLRFEATLPLYGQELGPDINPLEAKLSFAVKLDAGDFIGRDALIRAKEEGLEKRLVGFEMQ
ncbi:MAG: glycine cleavage system aminomethyltransferase GcvT, partial [Bacillota bacterium]